MFLLFKRKFNLILEIIKFFKLLTIVFIAYILSTINL